VDVALGVFVLEEQQLGDDQVGDLVFDRRAKQDDSLLEQPRKNVEGALAAVRALDDHRDKRLGPR